MKKIYLCVLSFISLASLHAQVAINTKYTLGAFIIDAKGDNPDNAVPTTTMHDDFIVRESGRVGIGIVNPDALLHINSLGKDGEKTAGFTLQDGTQGTGKGLTSNADGVAYWKTWAVKNAILGEPDGTPGITVPTVPTQKAYYLKRILTLAPGLWCVNISMRIPAFNSSAAHSIWIRTSFSDTSSSLVISNDVIGKNAGGDQSKKYPYLVSGSAYTSSNTSNNVDGLVSGYLFIRNSSSTDKTYYYMIESINSGNSSDNSIAGLGGSEEDNIIAIKIVE